ncbi:uncharacterized protein MONOS_11507 [Monocercomonoides exilis]|uniref:uncharacterized protein n=1 Tax=Monocercomonoides exilis TaxID=2049356 RepID=UPI003559A2CE|nr:hypothetical protein MONOS_11507 [Monocercomonoides exilis]|eukprot:MONOS_11507.1-p1 / transcript=MONOS_11507.1 / gene=MONOS_11507 / organism=Monocercomonoides_exilis_PA203 / gene_product=unspecified product / transcript_product=unspecified product / location=Mono_scaffold00581:33084-38978(+) / protein_length=1907 / sequence_SO=supercontig / SO=protein_coding / is_pseudo=false
MERLSQECTNVNTNIGVIAAHRINPCFAILPASISSPIEIISFEESSLPSTHSPLRDATPVTAVKIQPDIPIIASCASWVSDTLLCGTTQGRILSYECHPFPLPGSFRQSRLSSTNPPSFRANFPTEVQLHSPENATLNAAGTLGTLTRFNPSFQSPLATPVSSIDICEWSPSSFVASQGKRLHIYEHVYPEGPVQTETFVSSLRCVSYRPRSMSEIAVGGGRGIVRLLDIRSKNAIKQELSTSDAYSVAKPWMMKAAHDGDVTALAWHPTMHHWLATTGMDGTIRVWDVRHLAPKVPLFTLSSSSSLSATTSLSLANACSALASSSCNFDSSFMSSFASTSPFAPCFTSLSWSQAFPDLLCASTHTQTTVYSLSSAAAPHHICTQWNAADTETEWKRRKASSSSDDSFAPHLSYPKLSAQLSPPAAVTASSFFLCSSSASVVSPVSANAVAVTTLSDEMLSSLLPDFCGDDANPILLDVDVTPEMVQREIDLFMHKDARDALRQKRLSSSAAAALTDPLFDADEKAPPIVVNESLSHSFSCLPSVFPTSAPMASPKTRSVAPSPSPSNAPSPSLSINSSLSPRPPSFVSSSSAPSSAVPSASQSFHSASFHSSPSFASPTTTPSLSLSFQSSNVMSQSSFRSYLSSSSSSSYSSSSFSSSSTPFALSERRIRGCWFGSSFSVEAAGGPLDADGDSTANGNGMTAENDEFLDDFSEEDSSDTSEDEEEGLDKRQGKGKRSAHSRTAEKKQVVQELLKMDGSTAVSAAELIGGAAAGNAFKTGSFASSSSSSALSSAGRFSSSGSSALRRLNVQARRCALSHLLNVSGLGGELTEIADFIRIRRFIDALRCGLALLEKTTARWAVVATKMVLTLLTPLSLDEVNDLPFCLAMDLLSLRIPPLYSFPLVPQLPDESDTNPATVESFLSDPFSLSRASSSQSSSSSSSSSSSLSPTLMMHSLSQLFDIGVQLRTIQHIHHLQCALFMFMRPRVLTLLEKTLFEQVKAEQDLVKKLEEEAFIRESEEGHDDNSSGGGGGGSGSSMSDALSEFRRGTGRMAMTLNPRMNTRMKMKALSSGGGGMGGIGGIGGGGGGAAMRGEKNAISALSRRSSRFRASLFIPVLMQLKATNEKRCCVWVLQLWELFSRQPAQKSEWVTSVVRAVLSPTVVEVFEDDPLIEEEKMRKLREEEEKTRAKNPAPRVSLPSSAHLLPTAPSFLQSIAALGSRVSSETGVVSLKRMKNQQNEDLTQALPSSSASSSIPAAPPLSIDAPPNVPSPMSPLDSSIPLPPPLPEGTLESSPSTAAIPVAPPLPSSVMFSLPSSSSASASASSSHSIPSPPPLPSSLAEVSVPAASGAQSAAVAVGVVKPTTRKRTQIDEGDQDSEGVDRDSMGIDGSGAQEEEGERERERGAAKKQLTPKEQSEKHLLTALQKSSQDVLKWQVSLLQRLCTRKKAEQLTSRQLCTLHPMVSYVHSARVAVALLSALAKEAQYLTAMLCCIQLKRRIEQCSPTPTFSLHLVRFFEEGVCRPWLQWMQDAVGMIEPSDEKIDTTDEQDTAERSLSGGMGGMSGGMQSAFQPFGERGMWMRQGIGGSSAPTESFGGAAEQHRRSVRTGLLPTSAPASSADPVSAVVERCKMLREIVYVYLILAPLPACLSKLLVWRNRIVLDLRRHCNTLASARNAASKAAEEIKAAIAAITAMNQDAKKIREKIQQEGLDDEDDEEKETVAMEQAKKMLSQEQSQKKNGSQTSENSQSLRGDGREEEAGVADEDLREEEEDAEEVKEMERRKKRALLSLQPHNQRLFASQYFASFYAKSERSADPPFVSILSSIPPIPPVPSAASTPSTLTSSPNAAAAQNPIPSINLEPFRMNLMRSEAVNTKKMLDGLLKKLESVVQPQAQPQLPPRRRI